MEWLQQHGAGRELPIVRVKNKFAAQDSAENDGYRDLMLSALYIGDKGLRIFEEAGVCARHGAKGWESSVLQCGGKECGEGWRVVLVPCCKS